MPVEEWPPLGPIHKQPIFGDFLGTKHEILNYLPSTRDMTLSGWDERFIPEDCAYFAKNAGVQPSDMFVMNVTYGDCPDPWAMCFHNDFYKDTDTVTGLLRTFGKLPIHMRSWVKHIVAFPKEYRALPKGKKKVMASQNNGNILLYGPSQEWMEVLLHQTAHSLDLNGAFGGVLSNYQTWEAAIKADGRVASKLATKNVVENVAESTIMALLFQSLGVKDILGPPARLPIEDVEDEHWQKPHGHQKKLPKKVVLGWQELRHQQAMIRKAANLGGEDKGKNLFDTEGTCTHRVVGSSLVRKEINVVGDQDNTNLPQLDVVLSPGVRAINLSNAAIDTQYECHYRE